VSIGFEYNGLEIRFVFDFGGESHLITSLSEKDKSLRIEVYISKDDPHPGQTAQDVLKNLTRGM
jgi:hypothetical protein